MAGKKFFKILLTLMAVMMLALAGGCAGSSDNEETATIGVSLPTIDLQRWNQDGANLKNMLNEKGYAVDLEYAGDDGSKQIAQIERMIDDGVDCLVIAPVDAYNLTGVLSKAKTKKIPVIAYDRLIMESDGVSYHVTFDNKGVGTLIGQYIEKKLGLAEGKGPYNVEFFAGSSDDNNAYLVNDGVFEVLKKYIISGKLVVPSNQTDFSSISIPRWAEDIAKQRMAALLSTFYKDGKKLDAVISPNDNISYGIVAALADLGRTAGTDWPLITGQDADRQAVKNIISGQQSMTVFKDTRILAEHCADMVEDILKGKDVRTNNSTDYDNQVKIVPTYVCTPISIDKDNLKEELVDSDYYKAEDIGL